MIDHEHPTYETHEIVHRHHYPRYAREVEFEVDADEPLYDRESSRPAPRRLPGEDRRGDRATGAPAPYGELTDAYYVDGGGRDLDASFEDLRVDGHAAPTYDYASFSATAAVCDCPGTSCYCGVRRSTPRAYASRADCGGGGARYDEWAGSGFSTGRPAYREYEY